MRVVAGTRFALPFVYLFIRMEKVVPLPCGMVADWIHPIRNASSPSIPSDSAESLTANQ